MGEAASRGEEHHCGGGRRDTFSQGKSVPLSVFWLVQSEVIVFFLCSLVKLKIFCRSQNLGSCWFLSPITIYFEFVPVSRSVYQVRFLTWRSMGSQRNFENIHFETFCLQRSGLYDSTLRLRLTGRRGKLMWLPIRPCKPMSLSRYVRAGTPIVKPRFAIRNTARDLCNLQIADFLGLLKAKARKIAFSPDFDLGYGMSTVEISVWSAKKNRALHRVRTCFFRRAKLCLFGSTVSQILPHRWKLALILSRFVYHLFAVVDGSHFQGT